MSLCIRDMLSTAANIAVDQVIENPAAHFIARVNGGLVWSHNTASSVCPMVLSQLKTLCLVEDLESNLIGITKAAVDVLEKINDRESQCNT